MGKPIKYVVAVILKRPNDSTHFLEVKRPDEDKDLANSWGLPAVTLDPGELPEDGARRVCRDKLVCSAKPVRFLGVMMQKRNSYDIVLMDIEMVLTEDTKPDVHASNTTHTKYVSQHWTDNYDNMLASASHGSCCSSILLTDRGLLDRDEWIASLEGSDIVG